MKTTFTFGRSSAVALLTLTSIMLSSCEKRFDGTTEESAKASMESMADSLTDEEKKEFATSFMVIGFANLEDVDNLNKKLHGKTVAEINAMAAEISEQKKAEQEKRRIEQEKREKEEAERRKAEEEKRRQEEINSLTEKIGVLRKQAEENSSNQAYRDKIVISGASFYLEKQPYINALRPIISFTISNTTEASISRISLNAVLTSTGRKVPWVKDTFGYSFKGGLNPGEEQKIELDANMFSEWGSMKKRDDYHLQLSINKVFDETEEEIWAIHQDVEKEIQECEERLKNL